MTMNKIGTTIDTARSGGESFSSISSSIGGDVEYDDGDNVLLEPPTVSELPAVTSDEGDGVGKRRVSNSFSQIPELSRA